MSESWRERLVYHAYRTAQRLAVSMDERSGRKLFDRLGALAYRTADGVKGTVAQNLSRVLGSTPGSAEVQAATREAFRSYARYWFDTFHIRSVPAEELAKRMQSTGREHLDRAMEAGRGGLMALPHLGNWDVAGHWVALSGYRVTAVAEELKPRRLYRLFERHRNEMGLGIVPLSDTRRAGEELVRRIGQNELIALVADRDLKGTGVKVEMFGATRRMPAGPALLSLATGSPLMPCAPYDTEDGWALVIWPPLTIERTGDMRRDVAELTRKLAREFERAIEAAPAQWHMFQPAWPEEPA